MIQRTSIVCCRSGGCGGDKRRVIRSIASPNYNPATREGAPTIAGAAAPHSTSAGTSTKVSFTTTRETVMRRGPFISPATASAVSAADLQRVLRQAADASSAALEALRHGGGNTSSKGSGGPSPVAAGAAAAGGLWHAALGAYWRYRQHCLRALAPSTPSMVAPSGRRKTEEPRELMPDDGGPIAVSSNGSPFGSDKGTSTSACEQREAAEASARASLLLLALHAVHLHETTPLDGSGGTPPAGHASASVAAAASMELQMFASAAGGGGIVVSGGPAVAPLQPATTAAQSTWRAAVALFLHQLRHRVVPSAALSGAFVALMRGGGGGFASSHWVLPPNAMSAWDRPPLALDGARWFEAAAAAEITRRLHQYHDQHPELPRHMRPQPMAAYGEAFLAASVAVLEHILATAVVLREAHRHRLADQKALMALWSRVAADIARVADWTATNALQGSAASLRGAFVEFAPLVIAAAGICADVATAIAASTTTPFDTSTPARYANDSIQSGLVPEAPSDRLRRILGIPHGAAASDAAQWAALATSPPPHPANTACEIYSAFLTPPREGRPAPPDAQRLSTNLSFMIRYLSARAAPVATTRNVVSSHSSCRRGDSVAVAECRPPALLTEKLAYGPRILALVQGAVSHAAAVMKQAPSSLVPSGGTSSLVHSPASVDRLHAACFESMRYFISYAVGTRPYDPLLHRPIAVQPSQRSDNGSECPAASPPTLDRWQEALLLTTLILRLAAIPVADAAAAVLRTAPLAALPTCIRHLSNGDNQNNTVCTATAGGRSDGDGPAQWVDLAMQRLRLDTRRGHLPDRSTPTAHDAAWALAMACVAAGGGRVSPRTAASLVDVQGIPHAVAVALTVQVLRAQVGPRVASGSSTGPDPIIGASLPSLQLVRSTALLALDAGDAAEATRWTNNLVRLQLPPPPPIDGDGSRAADWGTGRAPWSSPTHSFSGVVAVPDALLPLVHPRLLRYACRTNHTHAHSRPREDPSPSSCVITPGALYPYFRRLRSALDQALQRCQYPHGRSEQSPAATGPAPEGVAALHHQMCAAAASVLFHPPVEADAGLSDSRGVGAEQPWHCALRIAAAFLTEIPRSAHRFYTQGPHPHGGTASSAAEAARMPRAVVAVMMDVLPTVAGIARWAQQQQAVVGDGSAPLHISPVAPAAWEAALLILHASLEAELGRGAASAFLAQRPLDQPVAASVAVRQGLFESCVQAARLCSFSFPLPAHAHTTECTLEEYAAEDKGPLRAFAAADIFIQQHPSLALLRCLLADGRSPHPLLLPCASCFVTADPRTRLPIGAVLAASGETLAATATITQGVNSADTSRAAHTGSSRVSGLVRDLRFSLSVFDDALQSLDGARDSAVHHTYQERLPAVLPFWISDLGKRQRGLASAWGITAARVVLPPDSGTVWMTTAAIARRALAVATATALVRLYRHGLEDPRHRQALAAAGAQNRLADHGVLSSVIKFQVSVFPDEMWREALRLIAQYKVPRAGAVPPPQASAGLRPVGPSPQQYAVLFKGHDVLSLLGACSGGGAARGEHWARLLPQQASRVVGVGPAREGAAALPSVGERVERAIADHGPEDCLASAYLACPIGGTDTDLRDTPARLALLAALFPHRTPASDILAAVASETAAAMDPLARPDDLPRTYADVDTELLGVDGLFLAQATRFEPPAERPTAALGNRCRAPHYSCARPVLWQAAIGLLEALLLQPPPPDQPSAFATSTIVPYRAPPSVSSGLPTAVVVPVSQRHVTAAFRAFPDQWARVLGLFTRYTNGLDAMADASSSDGAAARRLAASVRRWALQAACGVSGPRMDLLDALLGSDK